ncbi:hypothetical protein [Arthrobacter cavernae]|uniref:hypothetical protein n=1 Tax=Arthrobacter cavernae TaxID=2817681 RepID=UPI0027DD52B3|nr:hypothetical protein [Arthrobacter cavernae]
MAIEEIFRQVGLPEGCYINVSHQTTGASIVADDRIQGVSLTGSERGGGVGRPTLGPFRGRSSPLGEEAL